MVVGEQFLRQKNGIRDLPASMMSSRTVFSLVTMTLEMHLCIDNITVGYEATAVDAGGGLSFWN